MGSNQPFFTQQGGSQPQYTAYYFAGGFKYCPKNPLCPPGRNTLKMAPLTAWGMGAPKFKGAENVDPPLPRAKKSPEKSPLERTLGPLHFVGPNAQIFPSQTLGGQYPTPLNPPKHPIFKMKPPPPRGETHIGPQKQCPPKILSNEANHLKKGPTLGIVGTPKPALPILKTPL